MLTKDLLNYRTVKGQIHPQLQDASDELVSSIAEQILGIYQSSKNLRQDLIHQKIQQEVCFSKPKFIDALDKLVQDRCEFEEPDTSSQVRRWNIIEAGEALRRSEVSRSYEDYLTDLAGQFPGELDGQTPSGVLNSLQEILYSDLPEKSKLLSSTDIAASDLINVYNLAQIQGLLMNAQNMRVVVVLETITDRRLFISTLKFHQLLWTIESISESSHEYTFDISGPLQIFAQQLKYGRSLACFFPNLLWFKVKEICSVVKLDKKTSQLNLGKKHLSQIHSSSSKPDRYEPEWLGEMFKELEASPLDGWCVKTSMEYRPLGGKSGYFPDLECTSANPQRKVFIEVFHRWHKSQLEQRIKECQKKEEPLCLLVQRSLIDKQSLKSAHVPIVLFTEMITVKKISECLSALKNS